MEKSGAGKRSAVEAFGSGSTPPQPIPSTVYEVDIPILANSIFLNVKSNHTYEGIGYGARFVGYRTLPDGSQGPAEKQRLVRNIGDELILVDGIHVSSEKFEDIIGLLKDHSRKNDAIRMQFRTRVLYETYSPTQMMIPHQSSQRTFFHLSSVKRDMSIENAINAANGFRTNIAEIGDAIKGHDTKIKSLEEQISDWQKALEDEQHKRRLALAKKDRLTQQLMDTKELARPDTVRVLEEIKKTIIYGETATPAKGRSFMNDMVVLNESKELLEAAQLIGASKIPSLLDGALQTVVESSSSSAYILVLRTLYHPILREGLSSSSSMVHNDAFSIPWRYIAEAIAIAGDINDAELFVKGVLSQADQVKVSNKALISRRKYRYSNAIQSSKCHILDMLFPSWEVAIKKFKPEFVMVTQTLERVMMNNLHESARSTIETPSYSMQVEADIALGEKDGELSTFLRSESFSETFSRSKNGLISLQRIINDRINDAYEMVSYERVGSTASDADPSTSCSSTTIMKVEKIGIGRPENIDLMRDRQLTHVRILKMLMEGGATGHLL